MNNITAYSLAQDARTAVSEIAKQISADAPKLLLYFASSRYDPSELTAAMKRAFPHSQLAGCTTAGELASGRMLKGSLVAMAFTDEIVEKASVQLLSEIGTEVKTEEAFRAFERDFGENPHAMSPTTYAGIVLVDGLSGAEERLMDRIGDKTNVLFVGGSAGDDLKFKKTYVFNEDGFHDDAALLVLLKMKVPFNFLKTQSFKDTGKRLVATRVDEAHRRVIEFDHQPALKAYAKAIGQPEAEAEKYFMRYPVGIMSGLEPYVRSPQRTDGESIIFYCNLIQGSEVALLESTDIVADTKKALDGKIGLWRDLHGVLNFHCILRTLELEANGQCEAYGDLFKEIPMAGLSTYGEAYVGHINQTSTMLIF